jgi:sugar phosphate isomerase/epimerase
VQFDGEYGLDILHATASPDLVQVEMDTYHVKYSGLDPAAYLKKYANLCPLLHLKDVQGVGIKTPTAMGKGILDMRSIIDAAQGSGVQWLIVEEHDLGIPMLISTKNSYEYIMSILQQV